MEIFSRTHWLRHLAVCAVAWLCSTGAWADKVLTMVSTDYPPYFAADLPEGGTLTAITRAAFKAEGYNLEVIYRPWARVMFETKNGEHDGIIAVWYAAEREDFIAYTDAIANTRIGFFGRRNKPIAVQDLGALRDYTVGTVRGYANPPAFDAAKLRTEEVVDDLTNLKKLAADRIDLTLIDMALAHWLIRKNIPDAARKIVALEPPVETMPLYLGISRKTPDYTRVVSDFNRGLAKIRHNGEYARILKRLPLDAVR